MKKQVTERSQESSDEAATVAVTAVEGLRAEKEAALHELSTLRSTMNALQQVCTNWDCCKCVYACVCACVCLVHACACQYPCLYMCLHVKILICH